MTVLEALKEWLLTCPLLEGQRLNTNYLGPEPVEFSLVESPVNPVVKQYLDGSSTRQKAAAITAVQDYSPDQLQQLAASGFWAELGGWIDAQNDLDNLPQLEEGKTSCSVEITASHYIFQTGPQTARYQMQILLVYDQD
ncbi:MAG: hypothetical protein ACI3U8_07430 [Candidatus Onthomonas sp.]